MKHDVDRRHDRFPARAPRDPHDDLTGHRSEALDQGATEEATGAADRNRLVAVFAQPPV